MHDCPGCGAAHAFMWQVALCDQPPIDDDVEEGPWPVSTSANQ